MNNQLNNSFHFNSIDVVLEHTKLSLSSLNVNKLKPCDKIKHTQAESNVDRKFKNLCDLFLKLRSLKLDIGEDTTQFDDDFKELFDMYLKKKKK